MVMWLLGAGRSNTFILITVSESIRVDRKHGYIIDQ